MTECTLELFWEVILHHRLSEVSLQMHRGDLSALIYMMMNSLGKQGLPLQMLFVISDQNSPLPHPKRCYQHLQTLLPSTHHFKVASPLLCFAYSSASPFVTTVYIVWFVAKNIIKLSDSRNQKA